MNHQIKLIGDSIPQSSYGTPYFWFDSLSGVEKINDLFEYQLVVKVRDEFLKPAHGYQGLEGYVSKAQADAGGSPATHLDLQKLIGTEVSIQIRLDGVMVDLKTLGGITSDADNNYQSNISGARFYRGLVTRVEALAVKNRHAMYKITLVPWVWLLKKTTDYKIYQNKNVLQIIEEVLLDYPYPVDYRCTQDYPVLDFQVQYGESDYDFIVRLMQEHGINFHFEHSKSHLTFVLSDHNAAYQPMQAKAYQQLNIYPPNQRFPIQAEYIEQFEPAQQLVSGKVKLSDYQFKQPSLVQTSKEQFLWDHQHAEHEVYEWQQGDFLDSSSGQIKAKTISESLYQHGYRALGKARLKGLQTGFRFSLDNHPNTESNRDWIVLGTQTTIQDISEEKADNQFYDSNVEFMVQSVDQILRPDRTYAKPQGRPQTAIVVGPSGEEIHTDQYGRVKVQFHWDHYGAKNEKSTCWLRVSTAWAGNNFGTVHLPRIGQEVIVDFFNADPDMPFVAGRLTNPAQMPVWELPSQKALSGIKSKEIGGTKTNDLVMDDTPGEVQVQLKSQHDASELNLGYITRIASAAGRSDYRGEGFELRTDGWGVIRSAKGLLLSTYERVKARNHHTDIKELEEALKDTQQVHQSMGEAAIEYKAMVKDDQAEIAEQLKIQHDQILGKSAAKVSVKELEEAHVMIASPQGVNVHSRDILHLQSGKHTAVTTGSHLSLVSNKNILASAVEGIKLFAYKTGMKLIAASGDIDVKALEKSVNILAKLDINQTANKITLSANEEVSIIGGGSYTTWKSGTIETGTNGKWAVHAANHQFLGGKAKSNSTNNLQPGKGNLDIERLLVDGLSGKTLSGFKEVAFKVIDALGQTKEGKLDAEGRATVGGIAPGPATLQLEPDPRAGWAASDKIGEFDWMKSGFMPSGGQNDQLFPKAKSLLETATNAVNKVAELTGNDKLAKAANGMNALSDIKNAATSPSLGSIGAVANSIGALTGDDKLMQASAQIAEVHDYVQKADFVMNQLPTYKDQVTSFMSTARSLL